MEITEGTATVSQQIDQWMREGAELIRAIPSVFEERDGLRRRLKSAEEDAHQLGVEMTRLQGEVDRLQRGHAEAVEAMETFVAEIGQLTDKLRLKVKGQ
jgi:predicted nuclease with TOPRIM domain